VQLHHHSLSQLCLRRPEPRPIAEPLVLERSIARNGILFPVLVRPCGDRLFEVIDGEVRVFMGKLLSERATLVAGGATVPCLVVDAPTEHQRALWRLNANMHHALPADEFLDLCRAAGLPAPQAKPAAAIGNGQPNINDLLFEISIRRNGLRYARRMLRIIEAVRDFRDGTIGLPDTVEALRLSAGED
jgi:hypothetical protein